MKKHIFTVIFCTLIANMLFAQLVEDVARSAWFPTFGTAKFNALGGSTSSVGADLSASGINPAGLALFKKTELVISLNNYNDNYKNNYLGTQQNYTFKSRNLINYIGIVIPYQSTNPYFKNSAISFTYNKIADYNSTIQYQGVNNFGSLTQKFTEQLNNNNADTNQATFDYPLGASLAFGNYLIDTTLVGGKIKYRTLVPLSSNKLQNYKKVTNGYNNEYTFGWASQVENMIYLGASIVIPVFRYNYTKTIDENDVSNNSNNNFSFLNYKEVYNSQGTGVGLKLGIIVKPSERFRFGVSIHSPQSFYVTEDIYAELTSNNEGYTNNKTKYLNSSTINNENLIEYNYYYTSPGKVQLSSSYFWGNLKTTNSLKGFISGEIEFVNYANASYSSNNDGYDDGYYDDLNNAIRNTYQNNTNAKLGAEFSYVGWRLRFGYAFYGSPYKNTNLDYSKSVSSFGVGFRAKNSYIDFAISTIKTNTFNAPYTLDNSVYAAANVNLNSANYTLTYAIRF